MLLCVSITRDPGLEKYLAPEESYNELNVISLLKGRVTDDCWSMLQRQGLLAARCGIQVGQYSLPQMPDGRHVPYSQLGLETRPRRTMQHTSHQAASASRKLMGPRCLPDKARRQTQMH